MKKLTSKWNTLNKNGLKLSLICGLNWLIGFVVKSQYYLFSAVFLGLLTYYMPQDIQVFTVRVLEWIVVLKVAIDGIHTILSGEIKRIRKSLLLGGMYLFFLAGHTYITQHVLTEILVNRLIRFWLISFVLSILVMIIQPRLFRAYLFKNVINKDYLGIRKTTDDLPPTSNIYVDADENNADKRMKIINQNAIKKPYQGIVELSFLNREVVTAISYNVVQFETENERTFIDDDTRYYPIFTVHPFGNLERKSYFYHTLIKLKLSRKAAFIRAGDSEVKKDF